MAATPYDPVTFTSEPLTKTKLNKLANNTQWIYENMTRARYSVSGVTKDTALKMITGKSPFAVETSRNYRYMNVGFGSFFTVGCRPSVVVTLEAKGGSMHRGKVTIQAIGGVNIDHTGFTAIISNDITTTISTDGWIHWHAVGY